VLQLSALALGQVRLMNWFFRPASRTRAGNQREGRERRLPVHTSEREARDGFRCRRVSSAWWWLARGIHSSRPLRQPPITCDATRWKASA